eukprot:1564917-Heterocapsa_arctica.AAC.1
MGRGAALFPATSRAVESTALVPDRGGPLLLLLVAVGCRGIPEDARQNEEEDEERSLPHGTA